MPASTKNSEQVSAAADTVAAPPAQQLQVNVRLQPHGDSEQPIFSNFAMAQGAAAMVFLDFGFLEPSALPSVARLAQSGGKVPDVVTGRLACRMALGLDTAAQLVQSLSQVLQSAAAQVQAQRAAAQKSPDGK